MFRLLLVASFVSSTLWAREKPVVVVATGQPWAAAVERTLKPKYNTVLQKLDSEEEACRQHEALAVVSFSVRKGNKTLFLRMWNCEASLLAASWSLKGKPPAKGGLSKAMAKKLFKAMPRPASKEPPAPVVTVVPPVEQAPVEQAPQVVDPPPGAPPPPPTASEPEQKANRLGVFAVGRLVLKRDLSYQESDPTVMSEHDLSIGPMVGAELELFPAFLAFTANHRLGIRAHYSRLLGVSTANADRSIVLRTDSQDVRAMLVLSLRFGAFVLEPQAGVSSWSFVFTPSKGASKGTLASVDYRSVRGGARMGFTFGDRFGFFAEGNYRYLLSIGELGTTFYPAPRWRGATLDASIGPTWRIASGLETRLVFDWSQTDLRFATQPEDDYRATGARDSWLGATWSLGWQFQ